LTNVSSPTIYNRGNQSTSNGFNWIYLNSSGNIRYQYANGAAIVNLVLTANLNIGQWHHVVIVHSRTSKTIYTYVNGTLTDTDTYVDTAQPVTAGTAYIGTYGGSTTNYPFQGLIDEFKIYTYPLTLQQVQLDMNNSAAIRFGD
jgi:hypothetical protein